MDEHRQAAKAWLARWGLRASVAAITTGVLANRARARVALAGHIGAAPYDSSNVLHLGVNNDGGVATDDESHTAITATTKLVAAPPSGPTLRVVNASKGAGFGLEVESRGLAISARSTADEAIHAWAAGPFGLRAGGGAGGVRGDGPQVGIEGFSQQVGVHGFTSSQAGIGVKGDYSGDPGSHGTGVLGTSTTGPAVHGLARTASAVGLRGEHTTGGVGLEVVGRARFSTGGSGAIPAGQATHSVAAPSVTANSHVTVTLTGNPGISAGPGGPAPAAILWVERQPGTGFVVHLTRALVNSTPFSYLVAEVP